MASPEKTASENKVDLVQIVSLVLSVYILITLVAETLIKFPPATTELLDKIDFVICLFFLYDFFSRLYRAESKLAFLKWGWIDFISSIPVLPFFGWARLFRIIRILRALRSTKILVAFVYRRRARGALTTALLIAVLLTIFSSIAELNFETAPDSNIKTPEDALWWAFTTVTTVGYGDRYPVTTEGRMVAVLLMTAGVGLFATFTGFITNFFNESDKEEEKNEMQSLIDEVRMLRTKMEQVEALCRQNNVPGLQAALLNTEPIPELPLDGESRNNFNRVP